MAQRQEVFLQFLYHGDHKAALEDAHEIASEIFTRYEVDDVSVVVESLDEDAN